MLGCWRSRGELNMPTISTFFGIVIRMYFFDDQQHKVPHIHAEYSGQQAVFDIESGEILGGVIPKSKSRLVQAWIEIHRKELAADWRLAVKGNAIFKIEPLK
jgi:hypothetical protein